MPHILFFEAVTGGLSPIVQALAAQFQIVEVTDCAEALRKAEEIVPDLVIARINAPEPGGLLSTEMLRACELIGARRPAVIDIVELIPAYDHPAMISLRLAGYMILHVLGGWATGGQALG